MIATSLTENEVKLARKLRVVVLVKPVIAQNQLDGGCEIPAGRAVLLMPRDAEKVEDAYVPATNLLVAAPGTSNFNSNIPPGTAHISRKNFSYFLVLPLGKEKEYLKIIAQKSDIVLPN